MPTGFFQAGTLIIKAPEPTIPRCGQCGLWNAFGCLSPKMEPTGQGQKGILVVGESPGKNENAQGSQFVGSAGQRLQQELATLGVDLNRDCWLTNALICFPGEKLSPTSEQVAHCRPNLTKTIDQLKPTLIILLGEAPTQSLIGRVWKENVGSINRWAGWRIPDQTVNAWLCPTWDTGEIMREEERAPVKLLWWRKHLAAAVALAGAAPWPEGPPDWLAGVKCLYDVDAARGCLDAFVRDGKPVAFDFETTTIKPDGPLAQIVSCAVSDGETTVAYPWHGAAISATQNLLRSPQPKYGQNCKFEERWCRKEFGHGVRGWAWDGMLAAHILDNRQSVSGLKFQSYVRLGQTQYDAAVKPFLSSEGTNTANRIKQVDLRTLLRYNACDALLEFKVTEIQMQEMGVSL